jgi:hypothetical protein
VATRAILFDLGDTLVGYYTSTRHGLLDKVDATVFCDE